MGYSKKAWSYVHTGPATIAGQYLRHFWHPVFESARLAPMQAVPIRIMSEDFTLYRDEAGKPHVVAARCPHRGTQLSTGWVEGDSIRCFFHGWRFDSTGSCVEQPAEPKSFCHKIKIAVYPTQEQLGLIFAFFGSEDPPPLPKWPEFESDDIVSSMERLPCNYFQSAENILDDVHVGFAHRSVPELGGSSRGLLPPTVSGEETPFGLTVTFRNQHSSEQNHFIMPNLCFVPYTLVYRDRQQMEQRLQMRTLFWYVPIDDVNHYHVQVTAGPRLVIDGMRYERRSPHNVAAEIAAVLAGNSDCHRERPLPGKRKPDLVRIQDGVTIVGQGEIADRANEHLGASDAGVILLRKIWSRELRSQSEGKAIKAFVRPECLDAENHIMQ